MTTAVEASALARALTTCRLIDDAAMFGELLDEVLVDRDLADATIRALTGIAVFGFARRAVTIAAASSVTIDDAVKLRAARVLAQRDFLRLAADVAATGKV